MRVASLILVLTLLRYEIGFYGIETLNKKDMTNEEKLSKALQDFKTKYPSVTSADLQTFIIGWQEAVKNCFIPDVSNLLCGSFEPDNKTSSATKCKCGREKWEHPKAT